MDQISAHCGLVCTDCEAYIATQANDLAALEQMSTRAREEFGMTNASAESAMCDGCLTDEEKKCGYCFECQVRACGVEKSIANCAYCLDYVRQDAVCEKLKGFFSQAPHAQTVLDEIRHTL